MAREAWHDTHVTQVLSLARPLPGMRILELGCGAGRTLTVLKARVDVQVFGVEMDPEARSQAEAAGIPCVARLDDLSPDPPFDRILVFGVLERVHQPIQLLLKIRGMLAPNARMVVEAANLYEPCGPLASSLLQPWRTIAFSRNTLEALLRTAGFMPERIIEHHHLAVAAALDGRPGPFPRPFERTEAADSSHTGMGVSRRLAGYDALERVRQQVLRQGPSLELLDEVLRLVQAPTLERHLVHTVSELVDHWTQLGSPRAAHWLIGAALLGPHSQATRDELSLLAGRVAASLHLGAR